jgi:hypothetical protein
MGDVVWGTDFRKGKVPDLTELAIELITAITSPIDPGFFDPTLHDTLPCEYLPPTEPA